MLFPFLFCAVMALAENTSTAVASLGNFDGVLMTGAAHSQTIAIEGGTLSECIKPNDRTDGRDILSCKVNGGRITVSPGGDGLVFNFEKVAVLSSDTNHFYYGGTRTIRIANKDVSQRISATVNLDPKTPDRAWGFLKLNENGLQSAFEAYRR